MSDNKDDDLKNGLSAEDAELWREMTKDVDRLPGRDYVEANKPAPKTPKIDKGRIPRDVPEFVRPSRRDAQNRHIDSATARRLKRGEIAIEGKLDLHGMNQGDARHALIHFILNAQNAGKRCVLVVTGKGNSGRMSDEWLERTPGVLKRNVPGWLHERELASCVLQAVPARPKHGGDGALYVYLRRKRDYTNSPEPGG